MGTITTRTENGETLPAVCVKPPPLFYRIPADLREQAIKGEIDAAFETVSEDWWRLAPQEIAEQCFGAAFPGAKPVASAAGRSNGWVVVRGLGDPRSWNKKKCAAWERFEKKIAASIDQAEVSFHAEIRDRVEARKAAVKAREEEVAAERLTRQLAYKVRESWQRCVYLLKCIAESDHKALENAQDAVHEATRLMVETGNVPDWLAEEINAGGES